MIIYTLQEIMIERCKASRWQVRPLFLMDGLLNIYMGKDFTEWLHSVSLTVTMIIKA